MSLVVINRNDQDLIECDFLQHGSSQTETTLREELLDGEKSYHFCISHLSVPMKNAPMWPFTNDTMLFEIRARKNTAGDDPVSPDLIPGAYTQFKRLSLQMGDDPDVGTLRDIVEQMIDLDIFTAEVFYNTVEPDREPEAEFDFTDHSGTDLLAAAHSLYINANQVTYNPVITTYTASPLRPMYSVAQFIKSIQQFLQLFNQKVTTQGIDPAVHNVEVSPQELRTSADVLNYLQLQLTCDGRLEFIPRSRFFDLFTIHFSAIGAELLGIDRERLWGSPEGNYIMALTLDSFDTSPFVDDDDWLYRSPTNDAAKVNITFETTYPVFTSADQRIKVSVGSHLPMLSNVLINDQVQSSERDVAEAYFTTQVTGEIKQFPYQGRTVTETNVTSNVYAGQCNMIQKHQPQHTWNRLVSSYRLRYLRFHLFITYRTFDGTSYRLVKKPLVVDRDDYWQFSVRFVSDS